MKKQLKWALSLLAAYLLLVKLLELVERDAASAIRGYWDALWYSLITLSTVGYGDLVPVTPAGKLIGAVFVLSSVGLLTALIGLGLRMIGSTLLPRMRLRFARERVWYVFSEENADSAMLAAALRRESPDCLPVYAADSDGADSDSAAVRLGLDADALIRLRGGTRGVTLFYIGSDPWENYARALRAASQGLKTYSMGDIRLDAPSDKLQFFSPTETMGRCYWNNNPLKLSERRLVLIGCGKAGRALLERALLNNVFAEEREIEYHVFGETQTFSDLHPVIVRALDGSGAAGDRLFLHEKRWESARSLLLSADRVILCLDEDSENLAAYETLKCWYVSGALLHMRLYTPLPGLDSFGGREEILTPSYVLRDELNRRARMINEIYNEGSPSPCAWRDLSPFLRQSNIAAADHLLVKARYLLEDESLTALGRDECARAYRRYRELRPQRAELFQEMEHRRWMRFYQLSNWQYAPERDNALRRHPQLVPYAQLSPEEKRKDLYAWELFGRLCEGTPELS